MCTIREEEKAIRQANYKSTNVSITSDIVKSAAKLFTSYYLVMTAVAGARDRLDKRIDRAQPFVIGNRSSSRTYIMHRAREEVASRIR